MSLSNTHELTDENRRAVHFDIVRRALPGTVLYLLIWFIIAIPAGLYESRPVFFWMVIAWYCLNSCCRLIHWTYLPSLYRFSPKISWLILGGNFFSASFFWGCLGAYSVMAPDLSPIIIGMMISIAGLAAGGATAVAPSRALTASLLSGYLFPGCIIFVSGISSFPPHIGILFFSFWVGMFMVIQVHYKEYWTIFHNSILLEAQAEELKRISYMDGLTGVKNRAYFDEIFLTEWDRASRHGDPVSLLMLDLDHFKQINDQFGHLVGDDCLRHVARIFSDFARRASDTVARYGGEEFVFLLPKMTKTEAAALGENIMSRMRSEPVTSHGVEIHVHASIGLSTAFPDPIQDPNALLQAADIALYRAKESGRNQLVFKDMADIDISDISSLSADDI